MNFFLTIGLFSYGASFVILCADGLTPAMTINSVILAGKRKARILSLTAYALEQTGDRYFDLQCQHVRRHYMATLCK